MKYNYLLALSLVIYLVGNSTHIFAAPSLKGAIESSSLTSSVPEYTIFYDGKQTANDRDGFFLLPAQDTQKPLNILVCKKIIESFQTANNIKHFYVPKKEKYCFYPDILSKAKDTSLETKKLSENNKIPENTLIISMDPNHVESIVNWDITLPEKLIKLPKIVLRKDIPLKDLERSAIECTLCALDVARWHEKFPRTHAKSLT